MHNLRKTGNIHQIFFYLIYLVIEYVNIFLYISYLSHPVIENIFLKDLLNSIILFIIFLPIIKKRSVSPKCLVLNLSVALMLEIPTPNSSSNTINFTQVDLMKFANGNLKIIYFLKKKIPALLDPFFF